MDWAQCFNEAIRFLENDLTQPPDVEAAARIAGCSVFHFQRMFAYVAGMPLSQYIRRRKMSLAAEELQNGGKITDVALRYGYASPTAFNRAFQAVHGIAPSEAKKEGAALRAYPPIRFSLALAGGTALEYRIERRGAFSIVGICADIGCEMEQNFENAPALWARAAAEGVVEKLMPLMDTQPRGLLGVSSQASNEHWCYWVAVASTQAPPAWAQSAQVPAATWAVFPGQGAMPGAIQQLEKRIVTEWLPGSGYEYGDAPDIEVYQTQNPQDACFEIWLPVAKPGW